LSDDAVPDRLPRPVSVVEQVLAHGVVGGHHRKQELSVPGAGAGAEEAGSRFLAGAEAGFHELRTVLVDVVHQVSSVVHDDVRPYGDGVVEEALVLLPCRGMGGVYADSRFGQGRRDIVLG
jgi:hypothetical protein